MGIARRRIRQARPPLALLLVATIAASGCGSGDDDTADQPISDGTDATRSVDDVDAALGTAEGSTDAPVDDVFIPDGTGTVAISLPDGRTEARDVACSVYRDQFESTIEYSDILEADQSITFYYREVDDGADLQFTFQDPELGGLTARTADAITNTAFDGFGGFSAVLTPLVVGSGDPPAVVEVGIGGTCS